MTHRRANRGRRAAAWSAVVVALLPLVAPPPVSARAAKGNASAAAGFLEDAQNSDGGFGARRGSRSSKRASLWAAVALLAAGKHPLDEFDRRGQSLDGYLQANDQAFTTLGDLGLLAITQAAAGYGVTHYADPAGRLASALTDEAVRSDPGGAALAALGLVAAGETGPATSTARALLAAQQPDGGWGSSDSAATALVLQAVARTGEAGKDDPRVTRGLDYLHRAQANDGAVMLSIRTDPASGGGDVTSTAFALQALAALGVPSPRTDLGKTFRDGLTQYQQQTTGGLASYGSIYDSTFAPSVSETAQAFPAFNGTVFPLDEVAPSTSGPPKRAASTDSASSRVSNGTSKRGVSDASSTKRDSGAFQGAKAGQQREGRSGTADRAGSSADAKAKAKGGSTADQPAGETVTGDVVGATAVPRLAARAGRSDAGLSDETKAAIGLGLLLLLAALLGAWSSQRRPSDDERPALQRALVGGRVRLGAARARGSLAPAGALLIGLALLLTPLVLNLWQRAPQGERLLSAFGPHMTAERVAAYQRDVADLDAGVREATGKGAARLTGESADRADALATALKEQAPALAGLRETWPATAASLRSVVEPIAEQRRGYEALAALPAFGLFPWFLAIPGALLVLVGALALWRPRAWRGGRFAVAALGITLVVGPIAIGLWERAPHSAALVRAFTPLEQRESVVRVQNDFGQVALAQGALGGELVPALEKRGIDSAAELPATTRVLDRWVPILNDLTPVIGVMSDNVGRFDAVRALPPFTVFPWLFTGFGVLALALVRPRRPSVAVPGLPEPAAAESTPRTPASPAPPGPTPAPAPAASDRPARPTALHR